jgi:hypothetical protein
MTSTAATISPTGAATSPATPTSSSPSNSTPSAAPVGAIVGGVIGGVAFLVATLAALLWFCLRGHKSQSSQKAFQDQRPTYANPEPQYVSELGPASPLEMDAPNKAIRQQHVGETLQNPVTPFVCYEVQA